MAGGTINPSPMGAGAVATPSVKPSFDTSFGISMVADRLAMYISNTQQHHDTMDFFNLCLALARGIDCAIAYNEVPNKAPELPLLLKQICQYKHDSLSQAIIMVLMISVKNACNRCWFSNKDSDELRTLVNEIGSNFCSAKEFNTEASSFLPTVSTIMSRFYPQMKMGQILAFLEVKSGYGAFVIDFYIPRDAKFSPEDKIRLFVARIDNVETSSCLISPPHVNFLLNGKGVDKRTNVIMDTGPQIPTIVTPMLKIGTNLLQAVGQFHGNYIIVVAFMSAISTPICPALPNYVQPTVAILDSDSEIIEGPFRISLNCPISFTRIKIPVKGHSCKHLQCFDFVNFMDINSRRPSWRCPHCNQYVCFTDLRIDQNMAKVLEEVAENVTNVIISADGSWKVVIEAHEHTDALHETMSISEQDGPSQQEHANLSNAPPHILDLTEGDDEMDAVGIYENEDRKPFLANLQSQYYVNNVAISPDTNNTREVNQTTAPNLEADFWAGIYLSTYGSGTTGARSESQVGSVFGADPANFVVSPVLTDTTSVQNTAANYMQLQQFGNSNMNNEYGTVPSRPENINRTPIAVQGLPAQAPTLVPQQMSRTSWNTLVHDGPHAASQQQFSRSHSNALHHLPYMQASALQQLMGSQNWFVPNRPFVSNQPALQMGGLRAPSHLASSPRVPLTLPMEPQTANQLRMAYARSQSPSMTRSSAHRYANLPHTQIHQGGGTQSGIGSQQARSMAAAPQASHMVRPSPSNMGGGTFQRVANADGLVDLPTEQNWRPVGRMRGALSGQAYSDAFNQYIIQQTQPAQQGARPLSNMTSSTPNIPSQRHVLMANNRNAHATTEPVDITGGLGVLPQGNSGSGMF